MIIPAHSRISSKVNSYDLASAIIKDNTLLSNSILGSFLDIEKPSTKTMNDIGTAVIGSATLYNSFVDSLVNRIAFVTITSKVFENPWVHFKKGYLEYGETVEEIFVRMIDSVEFAPNAANAREFKRYKPNVETAFHRLNYTKMYPITISYQELKTAFLTWDGLNELTGKIIEQVYASAAYDEFLMMKYTIAKAILTSYMYTKKVSGEFASDDIIDIKALSNELVFINSEYNFAHVPTQTAKDDQYLILTAVADAKYDVDVLASAFNMDKVEFLGHKMLVDRFNFSSTELVRLENILKNSHDADGNPIENPNYVPISESDNDLLKSINGVLIDKNFFMIYDNLNLMTDTKVSSGIYWNYFYHVWKIYSTSPFANAIAFTSIESAVNSVTLSAASTDLKVSESVLIKATVTGKGFYEKNIEWSISGNVSKLTKISANSNSAVLSIGKDESSTNVTVTAICGGVSGTLEFTIS